MTKSRQPIPRTIKDSVLKEFNHRCAICGKDRPQIHHIDENPSNNDTSNLIPLCPSCHLTDQHNPTTSIDIEKLKLFRQFKDPTILKSQFHPLFTRMQFLNPVDDSADVGTLADLSRELIEFVAALEMGSFYSKRISELISRDYSIIPIPGTDDYGMAYVHSVEAQTEAQYLEEISDKYPQVASLVVELLRFQKW